MNEQLTMFSTFDPLTEVAKRAKPYYNESWSRINKTRNTSKFVSAVKKEFCPYGACGAFGFNDSKTNALCGYDMRTSYIEVTWYDDRGEKQKKRCTWKEFAERLEI